MARQYSPKTVVSRLFADSRRPIYLLDGSREIVFANQALADWLEADLQSLLGQHGCYAATSSDRAPEIVNQLCPAPQTWDSGNMDQLMVVRVGDRVRQRQASCFALGTGKDSDPMLVVLETTDSDAAPVKPLRAESLHQQLVELRRKHQGRYAINRLIGASASMRQVRSQIAVAATVPECRVVVVGNPGTGRETVARTIHVERHKDATSSLIRLACSVLDASLLRSATEELFDSSATNEKHPIALLLLDVDKLDDSSQSVLAELLTERGRDIATIATSKARLADLVALGEFREDLGCELVNLEVSLPSLRERPEDVPLIAQWLVEQLNTAGENQLGGFTAEAMDMLLGYGWPGEVAELTAFVEAAFQAAKGPLIDARDLPSKIRLAADAAAVAPVDNESIVMDDFLAEAESELIRRALQHAKGNKAGAARELGISRARILRRIEQLGIE